MEIINIKRGLIWYSWQNYSLVMLLIIIHGFNITGENSSYLLYWFFKFQKINRNCCHSTNFSSWGTLSTSINFLQAPVFKSAKTRFSTSERRAGLKERSPSPLWKDYFGNYIYIYFNPGQCVKQSALSNIIRRSLQIYQSGKDWENCVQYCLVLVSAWLQWWLNL